MSNFRIGQKVVCVDGLVRWPPSRPKKNGEVYTIIDKGRSYFDGGTPVVYLAEIKNTPPRFNGRDVGYKARRFRPVVEKSNDAGMAVLKKMLEPTKVDA
jgi:hypothetical protein